MPLPKWGEVRGFCLKQGYEERRTDQFRYQKVVSDNSLSGTMVSFGEDGVALKPDTWLRVRKRQLRISSEEDFWSGLAGGSARWDIPPTPQLPEPLPDYLVRFLDTVCHCSAAQIQATSRERAQEMLNDYHTRRLRRT